MKKSISVLGFFSIVVSIITWAADYFEFVYACPYCRTERTVIGLLGIVMMMKTMRSRIGMLIVNMIAIIGIITAANQFFMGIKRVSDGNISYIIHQAIYENAFLLSGLALVFISIQTIMINFRRFPKLAENFKP